MADDTDDQIDDIDTPEIEQDDDLDTDGAEDEFSIEIDGDEPEDELLRESEDDTPLQKKLRAKLKDAIREKHETARERDELRRATAAAEPEIVVGEKPTLESCDWDEERRDREYDEWKARKDAFDNREANAAKAAEERNRAFQQSYANYQAKLASIPLPPEEKAAAEQAVVAALPQILQSAIVNYADDPAKVMIALAKHPAKLAAMAQESDPIKFILAMREMEGKLKVVNRKKPPEPEAGTILRSSAQPSAAGGDKQMERLRQEAERTNDYSKLTAYKARKKAA